MDSSGSPEGGIFESLKRPGDQKLQEERARAYEAREQAHQQKAQARVAEMANSNSTLPTTIHSIQVANAPNTRNSFLARIFQPILSVNQTRPYTLSEALHEIEKGVGKLQKFGIFHEPIEVFIGKPSSTDPSTTPTDIAVVLKVLERSRLSAQAGTEVGNTEGSLSASTIFRNLFGGAESLSANASYGTRTRSAYQAVFDTPILSNPDFHWELGGLSSATEKPWSSHEEVQKGGWTKLRFLATNGSRHEFSYNGIWRQITGLSSNASPSIRHDAGDSVKSSITHTWTRDSRDNPLLPSRGHYTKTILELAGWGPLAGDVAFLKPQVEAQSAFPIPSPFSLFKPRSKPSPFSSSSASTDTGFALTSSFRLGALCPLPLGLSKDPIPSTLPDRFQLGGPGDIRGFRLSGLGPRDGADAVGGDVMAAGSINLLAPLPRVDKDKPLRLQAFVNGGRLIALKGSGDDEKTGGDVAKRVMDTVKDLGNGLPSMSAGVGLVYVHPAARMELNFSVPLVLRRGEEGRKGLQFGIGINML